MKLLLIDDLRSFDDAKLIAVSRYRGASFVMERISSVSIARTLDTARVLLEKEHFDVLLVDHDLGETDSCGADALKHLIETYLNDHKQLPEHVFAVSSNPAGIKKIEGYAKDIQRLRKK